MIALGDALTLLCTSWLFFLWFIHRVHFIKPSVSLLSLSVLTLLWPHILMRETIREYSTFADETFLYLVIFVLGGLLTTSVLPYLNGAVRSNHSVFPDQLKNSSDLDRATSVHTSGVMLIIAVMVLYLFYVSPTQTGLYAILFDPQNSGIARENSLKLIDFVLLKYLYLITYSLVAPLVLLVGLNLYYFRKPVNWSLLIGPGMLVCLFMLLTGARAGLVYLAVVCLALVVVRRRLKFKILEVGLTFCFFLVFPAILSQLREGGGDAGLLIYVGLILNRIFLLPTIISAWFLEYANTYGFGGWTALLGQGEHGNLYNAVALEYTERYEPIHDSGITAPTAYFIQNLYIFGWLGLIPSWVGLFLMNWPVKYIRYLPAPLKAPFYAVAMYYSLFFLQSGYCIVWVTNGYLFFAILIILLSKKVHWSREVMVK